MMDVAVFSDIHGNHSALQASIDYAVGKGITNFVLPVTFDNVALETIIGDIAARHQLQVEFRNEDVRALRFYFVWQPDEDLDAAIERLNLFESVNISKEGNTIVVE